MTDLAALRDLGTFAKAIDRPMEPWQAASLELRKRTTAIKAPRQSGKSRSLATLALHRALKTPRFRVLIISAGEEAAKRLLTDIRLVAGESPLLRSSVVDDSLSLVTLANGSEIRSVPASERQVRGWSVDLLIIDEAVMLSDELIQSAAIPTTAARPDARIVLASSASSAVGTFYDTVTVGLSGNEYIDAFSWALTDCWWISPATIAYARETMTPVRFAAEYEGVFASSADALFPKHLLDRVTSDFVMPGLHGLGQYAGLAGTDWGATTDRSACVVVSRLAQPSGLFAVAAAHAWKSGHPLVGPGGVVEDVLGLKGQFTQISTEINGLGYPLSQALKQGFNGRKPYTRIEFIHSTQDLKSAAYGSLRMMMERGQLALSANAPELLRELLLLRVELQQTGGERIAAGSGHDDLADALMLAAGPYESGGRWRTRLGDYAEKSGVPTSIEPADDGSTVVTGGGLVMPRVIAPAFMGRPFGEVVVIDDGRHTVSGDAVLTRGDLTLQGNEYLDRDDRGRLTPPPGYTVARRRR